MKGLVVASVTMSSREIAELTSKQHKDVIRDIRVMIEALKKDGADLRHVREEKDGRGYTACFHLDRELTETLLTGYSIPLRRRVIARLHELEQQGAKSPAELTRMDLLQLAMDAERERLALQRQVEELQPKAQGFERVAEATGSMTIREAAKDLQVKPGLLMQWLRDNRWIYSAGGSGKAKRNLAYQPRIDSGLMEHKITVIEVSADDGTVIEKAVSQPRITAKGLSKLAVLLGGNQSLHRPDSSRVAEYSMVQGNAVQERAV